MTERMTAAAFKAKRRKKPVDREGPIQREIIAFLRKILPDAIVHHCANESHISGKAAMIASVRKKRDGMLPGFPDIILLPYAAKLGAMFFEVKAEGNYATKAQKEVHAQLASLGYHVAVVRSAQDVMECLTDWDVGYAEQLNDNMRGI